MSRNLLHRRTLLCTLILQAQNFNNSRITSHIRSHTPAPQHNTSTTLSVKAHEHKRTGSPLRRCRLARLKTNNMFSHCPPSEFSSEILESRARPGPTMPLHSRARVTRTFSFPQFLTLEWSLLTVCSAVLTVKSVTCGGLCILFVIKRA